MANKKSRSIIDVYPTIYCVDLVVANRYATVKQINNRYCTVDNKDFEDSNAIAWTSVGYDKKTNRAVVIVKYCRDNVDKAVDKKIDFINTCAHEALHACMSIYSKIGEDVYKNDSNELFAYLVGWIAECIYKTWTKK